MPVKFLAPCFNMIYSVSLIFGTFAFASSLPVGVYVGDKGELGASFGGASASISKGGLHAQAGLPGGPFAAAGLGGEVGGNDGPAGGIYSGASTSSSSSSSSSAGNGGFFASSPAGHKNTFFDDIFNIPQSVLRSVNELLNKRVASGPYSTKAGVTKGSSASASSSASSVAVPAVADDNTIHSQGAPAGSGPTKYDQIFAIPQSALSAVAKFLNRL